MGRISSFDRRLALAVGGSMLAAWLAYFAHAGLFAQAPAGSGSRAAAGPAAFGAPAPAAGTGSIAAQGAVRRERAPFMLVYVTGAVRRPGLYRLPLDARVAAAVKAAGGALAQADLAAVDLAAVAEDGMQIVIPASGAPPVAADAGFASAAGGGTPAAFGRRARHHARKLRPGERIALNAAGLASLEELPGIGAKKASAILRYREAHRSFTGLQQLGAVPGIGPRLLERILPYLTLGG